MQRQEGRICFIAGKELEKLVEQRAKQEGITVSEYVRESIVLEMLFSGDVEAMGYVAKKVGKRVKAALIDRIGGSDLQAKVGVLTAD
jgi:hypothetical protein